MRRGLTIAALAICAMLGAAAPASANAQLESMFQDDDLLLHQVPEKVDRAMAELAALGVDRVKIPAIWRDIAPLDEPFDATDPDEYPADRIHKLDVTIRSAYEHGLLVLLTPRGGVPTWGMPTRPKGLKDEDAYRPKMRKWGQFVRMLGRRYDGTYVREDGEQLPQVDMWSVWNEPNWPSLLQPQSNKAEKPFSPVLYRRLYRTATKALRQSGHGGDTILLGETAPLGVSEPGATRSMKPGLFYRTLFCLTANLKPEPGCGDFDRRGPLLADGVAHHPYPVLAPPEFKSPDPGYIRLGDGRRLIRIIDAAARYGRLPGRLPVWYTEFGYQTKPPDPYRGISLRKQAVWNTRAERLAYRQSRVRALTQFLLRDSGPRTQYPPNHKNYWSNYQTGIRFFEGRRKPAYFAYRLPFMRLERKRFWGQVRPAPNGVAQTVRIEERAGGGWSPVGARRVTNDRGFFTVDLPFASGNQYRFVWNGMRSLPAVAPPPARLR